MTILAQDNYTRPDQSGWGTASDGTTVWSLVRGASTFSIASNQGNVTIFSNNYCVERAGTGTTVDCEQIVTFKRGASDVAGLTCRFQDSNNFYYLDLGSFTNNLEFAKEQGGSFSTIALSGTLTIDTTKFYSVHWKMIGNHCQARIWDASTSEPSSWDIDVTDTSFSGVSGGYGVVVDPNGATPVLFTSYQATDGNNTTNDARTLTETQIITEILSLQGLSTSSDTLTPSETVALASQLTPTETQLINEILSLQGSISLSEVQQLIELVIAGPPSAIVPATIILRCRDGKQTLVCRDGKQILRAR